MQVSDLRQRRHEPQAAIALAAVAIGIFGISGHAVAQSPVGPRTHSNAAVDAGQKAQRTRLASLTSLLAPPPEYRFTAPAEREMVLPPDAEPSPARTGVHRALTLDALNTGRWEVLDSGGRVWRLSVHSPGAAGIRLHFHDFNVARGRVWVHDGERDEPRVLGPYSQRGPYENGDFWSDFVLAETAVVEFEPEEGSGSPALPPFIITEISHMFPGLLPLKTGARLATSASCNLDVNCYPDWAETAKAVGHIVFEKGEGSYFCSGTLLETRNHSGTPYFLTADHCISEDAVARTVQAFWFYQTSTCNGTPLSRRDAPRTLGARYMAGGGRAQGDFTLLRLNSVPNGVVFSGWDPQEIQEGTNVTVIHHPSGDFKRISFGSLVTPKARTGAEANNYYAVQYSSGVTEGGSSGSGLYSAPGVLVGDLSNGPKADTPEGYCAIKPLVDNFGKFSVAYPALRDYLEDRVAAPPPAPPPSVNARTLTSGAPQNFSIEPVSSATLLKGSSGYQIVVPQGATRLEVRLTTNTPGADLDLFVRAGREPEISSGSVVADFSSSGPTGNETIVITTGSTPPLAAGTYYIAIGVFTTNTPIGGSIVATVTSGAPPPPPSGGTPRTLASGTPQNFSLGPAANATLFTGAAGYAIAVPQGAARLEIKLVTTTPNVDIDLFARFGVEPAVSSGEVVADHKSTSPGGNEAIVVSASSTPPLRAGTYYISLALFTTGVAATGTLTATVVTGNPPPPPPTGGPTVLTSGAAQSFTLPAADSPSLFHNDRSFVIDVPQGAARLDIQLVTTTPGADVDLFARFGQDPAVSGGDVIADHSSAGPTGNESISITSSSSPPLRAGRYYISLAVFTTGLAVNGRLTAIVAMSNAPAPPPPSGATTLTSGVPARFNLPPVDTPTLFSGDYTFRIVVPQNATKLKIQVASAAPSVDVDLYVRYESDTNLDGEGQVIADWVSEDNSGNEFLSITPSSVPPLRPGTYYVSLALFTINAPASGTVTATVESGPAGPAVSAARPLISGVATPYSLPAAAQPTFYGGENGFRIVVPPGTAKLEVALRTEPSTVDVDLYVRYGAEPEVSDGRILTDYRSTSDTGNEYVIVQSTTVPPLRPGVYFIALAVYSTGVSAQGTITATVTPEKSDAPELQKAAGEPPPEPLAPKRGFPLVIAVPAESKYDMPDRGGSLKKKPGRLRMAQ